VPASSRLPLIFFLLTLLSVRAPLARAVGKPQLPTLTAAHAAHSLTQAEASRAYPVHLRAVVTYYDNTLEPGSPRLFAMDSSGSIYVALSAPSAVPLVTGDLVDITGVTGPGQFAPIVDRAQVRFLGKSHLPAKVPRVSATIMMDGATDGQWVEVEGVVHAVRRYDRQIFLDLWMSDGILTAFTVFDPSVDYARLVDATVAIRGNSAPLFNAMGQMTGAHIIFPGMFTVTIEQAAPPIPFRIPVTRISDLLRYTPHSELQHRAHIRGSLTLLWPGKLICVEDDSKDLCAETQQTDPVRIGQLVDLLGFPSIGEFNPTFDHAIYRPLAGSREVVPTPLAFEQALSPSSDARLITVEGKLINENRTGEVPSITLQTGDNIFTAVLPISFISSTIPPLEYGTIFRVTGVCKIQSDGEGNTVGSTPKAKSFTIMERSVSDLVLVERPSWWNAAHTLAVLAIALSITIAAFCWLVVLRRRVKEQTATIRAQLEETHALKEAAEFQATHDGLTGLYNRKAIFEMLQREFAAAARTGNKTGIIMLDLDHFKKINDTYGHAAGDDVIRESVRRILPVVRATDWVGRYGGEEFLIVIPNCDFPEVTACAERIRCAISDGFISTGSRAIAVTASLGTTVASFPRHTTQDAVTAADLALYDAKHNGRNQVAFRDIESRTPELRPRPPAASQPAASSQSAAPAPATRLAANH
jgi:diguanylate cyclase (GGDEF)-like protein